VAAEASVSDVDPYGLGLLHVSDSDAESPSDCHSDFAVCDVLLFQKHRKRGGVGDLPVPAGHGSVSGLDRSISGLD